MPARRALVHLHPAHRARGGAALHVAHRLLGAGGHLVPQPLDHEALAWRLPQRERRRVVARWGKQVSQPVEVDLKERDAHAQPWPRRPKSVALSKVL